MACMMLTRYTKKYLDAEIIRTRDLKILNELDLIVDVGNVYDP